jgi:hypothetical protein
VLPQLGRSHRIVDAPIKDAEMACIDRERLTDTRVAVQVLQVEPGDAGRRGGGAAGQCPWLDGDRVDSVSIMDADGGAQVGLA